MTRGLRSPRVLAAAGIVALWCAASVLVAVWLSGRIRDWTVMTDELQYVKLALAVADRGVPVPSIHGTTVAVANQLYPVLIAPLYGSLRSPDAFHAAHVLNAVIMTSAVVPAYLLARELVDRAWAFAVALLTVVTPWIVLTSVLMSEVAAYPAFLWALLAFQRAITAPSPRRDILAAAALVAALLARTQFAVLVLVLPLALLWHELLLARLDGARGLRATLGSGARAATRTHRWLVALYVLGGAAAVVVTLGGYDLLGAYTTTIEGGSIFPAATVLSAVRHLDVVGIGCALVPLLLGGGWLLWGLTGRVARERHAFAALAGTTIAALALETASFDLRFGGAEVIRDRYLFSIVPLLLVAAVAALTEERSRPVAVGVLAVTTVVAATAHGLPFATFRGVSVDTPAAIANGWLADQSGVLGTGTFVAAGVALLGVVLALSLVLAPRVPLAAALLVTVLGASAVMVHAARERLVHGTSLAGRPLATPPDVVLDWVDAVLPRGATASLVPFPVAATWGPSAIRWWDVEFWNRTITRSYVADDGHFTYTGFPQRTIEIDPVTGVLAGTEDAPRFVVTSPRDPRFGLAGPVRARNVGLVVVDAERPYRAVWSTSGVSTDGWTRPGVPATVRVHSEPEATQPEAARLSIRIRAPATEPAEYHVATTDGVERTDALPAGEATDETVRVCPAPETPATVEITASTAASVEGPPLGPEVEPTRLVGVRVGPVAVEWTGLPCDG